MVRLLRQKAMYGSGGKFPIGRTNFLENYVYRPGGPVFITGTQVPRLHPVPLGERAVAFDEGESDDRIEQLKQERKSKAREAPDEQRERGRSSTRSRVPRLRSRKAI
jgi:hypothetical protein